MNASFITLYCLRDRPIDYEVTLSSPESVQQLLSKLIGFRDSEHCVALLLDTKNRVNGIHEFSIGSLNASLVHPRELFKSAILCNSNSIILAHNHPSGNTTPSETDISLTIELVRCGKLLQIPIIDHIIVSDNSIYSMRAQNTVLF